MDFNPDDLIFIPLGGSEQFGVNLNVYGTQGKWLAIDCGIGFPDERMPGVDILLPDPKFLQKRKKDLSGLIITHGHEDHVGAVPYLWPRLRCPIYCTEFTAAVLRRKFEEAPECRDAEIHIVEPGQRLELGPFRASFAPVSHSIPQTCSIILETDAGRVVHSGDWNLDPAPVVGDPTDPKPFQEAGKKGVMAYIGDSTNAMVEGRSGSEADVEKGLERVFAEQKGRITVTMFSSNIGRLRSICLAAKACGRDVAVIGRSLHKMIASAHECGYLNDIADFVPEEDVAVIPRDRIVLIVTGSQGETRAQLARIARGAHSNVRLDPGDTVIYSARAIPGNERAIIDVNNNLAAAGAEVIYPKKSGHTIHVSGHPYRDEIRDMFGWVKPRSVVAVHGEHAMIRAQADLARECGIECAVIPKNGSVINLSAEGGAQIIDHIETGLLAVEPGRIIDAAHPAIAERRKLQLSGTVHATLVMNARGDLVADPQVSCAGLSDPGSKEGRKFEEGMIEEIEDILADLSREELYDDNFVSEEIRIGLRRYVSHMLRMKPKVSVHVVRV